MSDILIVDDEKDIRELIADILEDEGFATRTDANSDEAMDALLLLIPYARAHGYRGQGDFHLAADGRTDDAATRRRLLRTMTADAAIQDGRIKKGDLILLEAMGGGLTWGACALRL